MGPHYDIEIRSENEGLYVASVKQLPGFRMEAPSPEDLELEVQEAIRMYLELSGRRTDGLDFSTPVRP